MGVIYKITNRVNGKAYVGKSSQSAETRWGQHRCNVRLGVKGYLYSAIRKYGLEAFTFEVIGTADSNEALNALEIEWISKLHTANGKFGYNCTPGGDGAKHGPSSRCRQKGWRTLSDVTKAKISAAHKGRPVPRERVERQAAALRGRKQPADEIDRRRETNRQVWASKTEEQIAEHAAGSKSRWNARTVKPHEFVTPESIAIVGRKSKAWWASPAALEEKKRNAERNAKRDHVAAMEKAWETRCTKGDDAMKETNRKIGEKQRAYHQTPEAKEKLRSIWNEEKRKAHADIIRGRKMSPESRVKMSEAAKLREAKKRADKGYEIPMRQLRKPRIKCVKAVPSPEEIADKQAALAAKRKAAWTDESRAAWSTAIRKRLASPSGITAVSNKCSIASKSWWDAHPEAKERMKTRFVSEETRRKCAEAARRGWETRSRSREVA